MQMGEYWNSNQSHISHYLSIGGRRFISCTGLWTIKEFYVSHSPSTNWSYFCTLRLFFIYFLAPFLEKLANIDVGVCQYPHLFRFILLVTFIWHTYYIWVDFILRFKIIYEVRIIAILNLGNIYPRKEEQICYYGGLVGKLHSTKPSITLPFYCM